GCLEQQPAHRKSPYLQKWRALHRQTRIRTRPVRTRTVRRQRLSKIRFRTKARSTACSHEEVIASGLSNRNVRLLHVIRFSDCLILLGCIKGPRTARASVTVEKLRAELKKRLRSLCSSETCRIRGR